MRFRPCIDLRHGRVTQIVGSSLGGGAELTNFDSVLPSSYYSDLYRTHDLTGGHVIKLGPEAENDAAALEALSSWPGGLQLGGGVTADNAAQWIERGASHVIVTSYVFREGKVDFERLDLLQQAVGKKHLVLDLSCRKVVKQDGTIDYVVVTDRWTKLTQFQVEHRNLDILREYCDEFLIHGVDVEGKKQGIESRLVEILGAWCPDGFPVTYAGGVTSLEDLELIKTLGRGKVDATIGSALDIFGGNLSFNDVLEWNKKQVAS
jgi:phosphoribosylformimino-5-aminoimidazole carboxamide ribotide isomerase